MAAHFDLADLYNNVLVFVLPLVRLGMFRGFSVYEISGDQLAVNLF